VPNCGDSFEQCFTTCPAGYHAAATDYNAGCAGPGSAHNHALCQYNTGTFEQCGITCPSGWHLGATDWNGGCPGACCTFNHSICIPD
jgi:hypothetical protein